MTQVNDRSHKFSYGLKDLVEKKLVEKDGRKFQLADKAFLNVEDRPETVELDTALLDEGRAVVQARKREKKSVSDESTSSSTKTKRNSQKRKASHDESCGKDETGDVDSDTDGQMTEKKDHKKNKKTKREL